VCVCARARPRKAYGLGRCDIQGSRGGGHLASAAGRARLAPARGLSLHLCSPAGLQRKGGRDAGCAWTVYTADSARGYIQTLFNHAETCRADVATATWGSRFERAGIGRGGWRRGAAAGAAWDLGRSLTQAGGPVELRQCQIIVVSGW